MPDTAVRIVTFHCSLNHPQLMFPYEAINGAMDINQLVAAQAGIAYLIKEAMIPALCYLCQEHFSRWMFSDEASNYSSVYEAREALTHRMSVWATTVLNARVKAKLN